MGKNVKILFVFMPRKAEEMMLKRKRTIVIQIQKMKKWFFKSKRRNWPPF